MAGPLQAPASLPLAKPTTSTPDRIQHAARELETQFASQLIKSMRSASPGDPFGGDTTFRDMHDQQLAKELTKGKGLGLQSAIVQQLERSAGGSGAVPSTSGHIPLNATPAGMPLRSAPQSIPLQPAALPLRPSTRGESLQGVPVTLTLPPFAPAAPRAVSAAYGTAACTETDVDCSTPDSFVASIWPAAQQTANDLGVSPVALVAQAALETNWGRSMIGRQTREVSNNLFGIKAGGSWGGPSVSSATHEYVGGQRQNQRDNFRAYASVTESFRDYARLLRGDRYQQARAAGGDVAGFAAGLQRAGYATDPNYASKITSIANGETMRRALSKLSPLPRG